MNPDATLKSIEEALTHGWIRDAVLLAEDLKTWLSRGGLVSCWHEHPMATTWLRDRGYIAERRSRSNP